MNLHLNFADTFSLKANELQISQVIKNIVCNALDFRNENGELFISTEDIINEAESFIKISIKDNGIGIPAENLQKIFEPYFSTKPMSTSKGRGLGLSICYSIIKKHGGKIEVQSEINKGTTISIFLPAIQKIQTSSN